MGCGRVGSRLAETLDELGHSVAILDQSADSFRRLSASFQGRTVEGVGFDRDNLVKAGIDTADAFAAVSSGDNSNIIAARVARETYGIDRVVARIYDPRRAALYARLGIPTVATVSWTTEQMLRLLLPSEPDNVWTDDLGAVEMHRVNLHRSWFGHRAEDLTHSVPSRVVLIYRAGGVILPTADSVLQEGDEPLLVSHRDARAQVIAHCEAPAGGS